MAEAVEKEQEINRETEDKLKRKPKKLTNKHNHLEAESVGHKLNTTATNSEKDQLIEELRKS